MTSLQSDDDETSTSKRRRSRWDPHTDDDKNSSLKKRKLRWDNEPPKPLITFPKGIEFDPELLSLKSRLIAINSNLKSSQLLDDRPINARSPSPEPVYDNLGIRINTREYRARVKLNSERRDVIFKIATISPEFKPPGGHSKTHFKKIYVPIKEYPGYNFIGLIIGPRGNTQKRMEKETGTKISLRGKGSSKRDSSDEELHVVVEADSWECVEAGAMMVEALLKPVDDVFNVHKMEQLKELAALNGTLDNGVGRSSEVSCEVCGDFKHSTSCCPLKKKPDKNVDEVYQNFLAEMGGSTSESWWLGGPETSSSNVSRGGSGSSVVPKGFDENNLYVGYLPVSVDDAGLIGLFSSFGEIVVSKVVKDMTTGVSKGYGFVKFANVQQANAAIATMNGYALDGRNLAVRVAGKPPQPTIASFPNAHLFPTGPVQPGAAFVYPPAAPQFGVQYPPQPKLAPLPNVPVLQPCIGPAQSGGTFTYPHVPQYPSQPTIAPVPNAVLPPCTVPTQPGGTFTYPPVSQFGVQYPPPLVPPSKFLPESVSSENRYDFASFDEKQSYSSKQPESSPSVPVYTNGNSVISKSASPYTYVLSNGTVLPPFPVSGSSFGSSQSPSDALWDTSALVPSRSVSAEKSKFKSEAEYVKFVASMKWTDF